MSKIVFVQKEVEDKLGPMILAAYLKSHGCDAEILIDPQKNIQKLKKSNPEFIGLSLCSPSVNWSLSICRFIKENMPDSLIILGGPHPTFFPQIIEQPEVDIVCIGEGEKPLLQIMKQYNGKLSSIKDIPNLHIKVDKSLIKNPVCPLLTEEELSSLPPSDRDHYENYVALRKNPHKKIWTSRGCPYNCSYCFNHAYKALYKGQGKLVRQRSVESVIEELKELKKYGWKCLEIVDDQFLLSKTWVPDFCDQYTKYINLPFTCNSTAKEIKPDTVKLLKKAGCKAIYFAIESGIEETRRKVYNKPVTNNDIYNAADALHLHNMPFLTFNMIGLPDETLEDIYETVNLNQKIKTTYPWCSILQPYPGTRIAQYFNTKEDSSIMRQFTYSYFQASTVKDPMKQKLFSNAQKLFAYFVSSNTSYDSFIRMVSSPMLSTDKFYPLIFYWYYGMNIKRRYGINWLSLFRYWLYSKQ